jgi:hypothetical protein
MWGKFDVLLFWTSLRSRFNAFKVKLRPCYLKKVVVLSVLCSFTSIFKERSEDTWISNGRLVCSGRDTKSHPWYGTNSAPRSKILAGHHTLKGQDDKKRENTTTTPIDLSINPLFEISMIIFSNCLYCTYNKYYEIVNYLQHPYSHSQYCRLSFTACISRSAKTEANQGINLWKLETLEE